jgi:hypothetical protein
MKPSIKIYLILRGVGGPGVVCRYDVNAFPAQMEVDFVRVIRKIKQHF